MLVTIEIVFLICVLHKYNLRDLGLNTQLSDYNK